MSEIGVDTSHKVRDNNSVQPLITLSNSTKVLDIPHDKFKWQMTVDFVMIVGKYFESYDDFINIMKVCKMYEELVLMYKFNPISDPYLFENIQTQHFYNRTDTWFKVPGLSKYVYWDPPHYLTRNKASNVIFKDSVMNKVWWYLPKLEEWSNSHVKGMIYDSSYSKVETLYKVVYGKSKLYFISIDSNNNIFGHFHPGEIIKDVNHDSSIYMFSLRSSEMMSPEVYYSSLRSSVFTEVYSHTHLLYCGSYNESGYKLSDYSSSNSYIGRDVHCSFIGCNKFTFTGKSSPVDTDGSVLFSLKRLVVIEMN